MKNVILSTGLTVAAATLAGSAAAADVFHEGASAPAITTTQLTDTMSKFVAASRANAHASGVALYPTADSNVVFVTFRMGAQAGDQERIAMVETRDGRVVRVTDFAAGSPTAPASVAVAAAGDVQSQARALLIAAAPSHTAAVSRFAGDLAQGGAQAQAANLLRSGGDSKVAAPRHLAALPAAARTGGGDSQEMAKRLLLAASGE